MNSNNDDIIFLCEVTHGDSSVDINKNNTNNNDNDYDTISVSSTDSNVQPKSYFVMKDLNGRANYYKDISEFINIVLKNNIWFIDAISSEDAHNYFENCVNTNNADSITILNARLVDGDDPHFEYLFYLHYVDPESMLQSTTFWFDYRFYYAHNDLINSRKTAWETMLKEASAYNRYKFPFPIMADVTLLNKLERFMPSL